MAIKTNNYMVGKPDPSINRLKKHIANNFKRLTSRSIANVNEQTVRKYIDQQSTGDFEGVARLAKKMSTDGAYIAALHKRINTLIQTDFLLLPSDQESLASKYIADSMLKVWWDYVPEYLIFNLLENYLSTGVGLGYITWNCKVGVCCPNLEVLDVEYLRYDQSKCKWEYRTSGETLEVVPGNGNWLLFTSWLPGKVSGFAAQLGLSYLNKAFAIKDWGDYKAASCDSIAVVKQVEDALKDDQSDIDSLVSEIQANKLDRVLYVPKDKDISFQESVTNSASSTNFSALIDETNKTYQICILGQNLTSNVDGGSYAATEIHAGIEKNLIKSDSQTLSTVLRNQLLMYWIDDNFGVPELTPYPSWDLETKEDLTEIIDGYIKADELLKSNGFKIDNLPELLETFGFKVVKAEETPQSNEIKPMGNGSTNNVN
jgi:phage gp29-like protein